MAGSTDHSFASQFMNKISTIERIAMIKFFLFFGLSLLTAMPPSTILGHGNEEHPGGLFAKLKDAVFGSYGD